MFKQLALFFLTLVFAQPSSYGQGNCPSSSQVKSILDGTSYEEKLSGSPKSDALYFPMLLFGSGYYSFVGYYCRENQSCPWIDTQHMPTRGVYEIADASCSGDDLKFTIQLRGYPHGNPEESDLYYSFESTASLKDSTLKKFYIKESGHPEINHEIVKKNSS